jgi:hypothetical protein
VGEHGISFEEWWYRLVTLIEVRNDTPAGVCGVRLTWIGAVVVEIWGEDFPHSESCAIFEVGGAKPGSNFLRSGAMTAIFFSFIGANKKLYPIS